MFTCSFVLRLTVIKPWLKLPTGGHGHVICMGNLREVFFFKKILQKVHTETHTSSFIPYKQVSGRNYDHEWLRITNAFILCDLVWKVQKRHAVNREGSFKVLLTPAGWSYHRHGQIRPCLKTSCHWKHCLWKQMYGNDIQDISIKKIKMLLRTIYYTDLNLYLHPLFEWTTC